MPLARGSRLWVSFFHSLKSCSSIEDDESVARPLANFIETSVSSFFFLSTISKAIPTGIELVIMVKNIVVLGGGFAGLSLAHKLLKEIIPKVKDAKLILVSLSTHLYWNMAAVRAVLPDEIPEDKLFRPIKDGFANYPSSQFELVFGEAKTVDIDQSTVLVRVDGDDRIIPYEQLILATGSSVSSGLPLKHIGSTEETKAALRQLQSNIKAAKSIVVAGGGVTGAETVGEIAHAYGGKKNITFIIKDDQPLPGLLPSVGKAAVNGLTSMNTKIIRNATVVEVKDLGSSKSIHLSNGDTISADVYLPLFGVRANTSYIPVGLLGKNGDVQLDPTLRVTGTTNVWALGDVANVEIKQAMKINNQVPHLVKNLDAVLSGRADGLLDYKPSPKVMVFVTMGKKKGTGQMGGFKAFSWLVSTVKGPTLFIDKAQPLINGS
ncbi:putative amid-like mitochondrial oxidoreductase protein [Paramyrothecium foliicola]|nr:putative amid-like mitochondrial oxidoreductase protein [Paramyrothecium foliicola]